MHGKKWRTRNTTAGVAVTKRRASGGGEVVATEFESQKTRTSKERGLTRRERRTAEIRTISGGETEGVEARNVNIIRWRGKHPTGRRTKSESETRKKAMRGRCSYWESGSKRKKKIRKQKERNSIRSMKSEE